MGYYLTKINIIERIIAGIAAICMIFPTFNAKFIGIMLIIFIFIYQKYKRKNIEKQLLEAKT